MYLFVERANVLYFAIYQQYVLNLQYMYDVTMQDLNNNNVLVHISFALYRRLLSPPSGSIELHV